MTRKSPTTWSIELTDPDTLRTLKPDLLTDPNIIPSLNRLPRIEVPVRRSDAWLDFPDGAAMTVTFEGVEQPIDELTKATDERRRNVLEGVGGVELRGTVRAEFDEERRHLAAEQLIQNNTSYTADVLEPDSDVVTGETVQSASTTAEFADVFSDALADDTLPVQASGDTLVPTQTAFVSEAENATTTGTTNVSSGDFSNGEAQELINDAESIEFDFTLEHDIPAGEFTAPPRIQITSGNEANHTGFEILIDGTLINSAGSFNNGVLNAGTRWVGVGSFNSELQAGTHTLTVDAIDGEGGDPVAVDVLSAFDERFTPGSNDLDNTLNTSSGYLDDPPLFPSSASGASTVQLQSDDVQTAFSFIEGTAELTIDDTSGNQRVQVSFDRGQSFEPTDGTEDNTSSVTVDEPGGSATLRSRLRFDAYEPNGARSQTPRLHYDPQTLSDYELRADIRQESLLVDETFDDDLASILSDIAGSEYLWSYRIVDGDPTVTFLQPGQRVSDSDPDIGDVEIRKNVETFRKTTIIGASQAQSNEEFTIQDSFVSLLESDIKEGSEAVYDQSTDTTFERGDDYEMQYQSGEIRRIDGGDLSAGQTLLIDYSYEARGSFTSSGVDASRPPNVRRVPAVTSDRQAEQLAYTIQESDPEISVPGYSGSLFVPRSDVTFDVIEAVTLSNLDLPADATPLGVRGSPELSERGLRLELGAKGRVERALAEAREQLRQLSKRS